jgi:UDP-2-acetamido-2-deoxy-ribo-hexuluronate aminotransferase
MQKIYMVDLQGQHAKIQAELDAAMQAVIASAAFINGPAVEQFANELTEYLEVKYVIPCANGTDALQLALMALEIPKDKEVLVPVFNYVATAEVIALLGLKPVFVDVDPLTFNIDVDKAAACVTPNTAAIMPVHLFGQCADMEGVMELAEKHKLYVIEDNAQAIGADYKSKEGVKKAGTIGEVGTTSFFPSKNLGCMGDGGAVFTNSSALAAKIKTIANHGQRQKYTYSRIGINSRLDTLQAAVLSVKLKYLDSYIAARQEAAAVYGNLLKGVPELELPVGVPGHTHVFHQYTLKVKGGKRDKLQDFLAQQGVPSMIYYPSPLHLQEAYSYLGYNAGDFPIAEQLCQEVLSLPMHTELTKEQIEYIARAVIRGIA